MNTNNNTNKNVNTKSEGVDLEPRPRRSGHDKIKPLLFQEPGRAFVESLLMLCRPWSPRRTRDVERFIYSSYEEFPLSEGVWEEQGKGGTRRPDALLYIDFMKGSLYYQDALQILIEIKESRDDLVRDTKMFEYLEHSDYLYLAVVPDLIEKAIEKVVDYPNIGVFDITTGMIHKLATRQDITENRSLMNCRTVLGYYRDIPERVDDHIPAACLGLGSTPLPAPKDDEAAQIEIHKYYQQCMTGRYDLREMLTALKGEDDSVRLAAFNNAITLARMDRQLII